MEIAQNVFHRYIKQCLSEEVSLKCELCSNFLKLYKRCYLAMCGLRRVFFQLFRKDANELTYLGAFI